MTVKVPSVERAMGCLEILATSDEGLALADLARILAAPKSSVLVILRTLVTLGYVERIHDDRYIINSALMGYGTGWIGGAQSVLVRSAWKTLHELASSVQETCFLATITREFGLRFLAKVISPREIRYDVSMRKLSVPHKTASGRAMMAYWTQNQLASYLMAWQGRNVLPEDRVDPIRLFEQLAEVRERGVARIVDEWVAGATGVSAPIFSQEKVPVAAITVGAVTARYLADKALILHAVKNAAAEVTSLLPPGLRALA